MAKRDTTQETIRELITLFVASLPKHPVVLEALMVADDRYQDRTLTRRTRPDKIRLAKQRLCYYLLKEFGYTLSQTAVAFEVTPSEVLRQLRRLDTLLDTNIEHYWRVLFRSIEEQWKLKPLSCNNSVELEGTETV